MVGAVSAVQTAIRCLPAVRQPEEHVVEAPAEPAGSEGRSRRNNGCVIELGTQVRQHTLCEVRSPRIEITGEDGCAVIRQRAQCALDLTSSSEPDTRITAQQTRS